MIQLELFPRWEFARRINHAFTLSQNGHYGYAREKWNEATLIWRTQLFPDATEVPRFNLLEVWHEEG